MDPELKTDGLSPDDERKKRIEDLLLIIGGTEVMIRNNTAGKFGGYPPLARQAEKLQQQYLEKLRRVLNGLPETQEDR